MAKVDLRKIKDQATQACEKKQYAKAAELYLQIAEHEPGDPDWRQRAGEALRKVPDAVRAIVELGRAAEGYARGGFLLKAIAVCKVILQLDARHTATQATLTALYAKREGAAPPGAARLDMLAAATDRGRASLPLATALRPPPSSLLASPSLPLPSSESPRAIPLALSEPTLGLVDTPALVDVGERRDDRPPPRPPTLLDVAELHAEAPIAAPLDALPLRTLLGGRLSAQFAAVRPDEPTAYEIALDEGMSLEEAIGIAPSPSAPPQPASPPPRTLGDEADFGGLLDERAAPPPLPRIPLLSSLAADDLRHVIERVDVRDYAPGERILRQGAAGGSLFVIVHGRVQILVEEPARDLAQLEDGAFFGELALLTNFPRSATAVALAPTQLLEISRELVGDIVRRSPDVLKTLLRFFRDRLLDRLLGSSPLFTAFSPEEARRLSDQFLFLELEPGMRLIVEGERAPGLFLLLCGEARVRRGATEVARLSPGDVCGEMSLLTRAPASATIETTSKCWALELPRERFQEVVLSYPQMLEYVSDVAERRKQENLRVDFF